MNSTLSYFSYFNAPVSGTVPGGEVNVKSLHRFITTNAMLSQATERVRAELPDKKRFNYAKTHLLPYVTPGGIFSRRSRQGLVLPSGLLVIDIDHLDSSEEACRLRDTLAADTRLHPALTFVSPSREGVKAFVPYTIRYDLTPEESLDLALEWVWTYLDAHYAAKPDEANKDICRACLVCHDPEAKMAP